MTTTGRSNWQATLKTVVLLSTPRRHPGRRRVPDRRALDRADLPVHRGRDQHGQLVLQRQDRYRRRSGEAHLRGGGPAPLPDGPRADDARRTADAEALRDPSGAAERLRDRPEREALGCRGDGRIRKLLTEDELRGVLAHELGHVRNHDILLTSVVASIASAITWIGYLVLWGGETHWSARLISSAIPRNCSSWQTN